MWLSIRVCIVTVCDVCQASSVPETGTSTCGTTYENLPRATVTTTAIATPNPVRYQNLVPMPESGSASVGNEHPAGGGVGAHYQNLAEVVAQTMPNDRTPQLSQHNTCVLWCFRSRLLWATCIPRTLRAVLGTAVRHGAWYSGAWYSGATRHMVFRSVYALAPSHPCLTSL